MIRWLLWIVTGVLAVLFLLILAIHLPPAQKLLTEKVSNYLSNTTGAVITIERIHLSFWDGVAIKRIKVSDQNGTNLLLSDKLVVMPDLFSLLSRDIVIEYLGLENTSATLAETEQGLNIQFIFDAFDSETSDPVTTEQSSFSLLIRIIHFDNINLEYQSIPGGAQIDFNLDQLEAGSFNFSTATDLISLNQMKVDGVTVDLLSTQYAEPSDSLLLPPLDFGTGFDININQIEIEKGNVSYHFGQKEPAPHFDPEHIDLVNTQLNIEDILISDDSLGFNLNNFTTDFGGFNLTRLSGKLAVGLNQSEIANLQFVSDSSTVDLDLIARYHSWVNLLDEIDQTKVNTTLEANLYHQDFAYFIDDSIAGYTRLWPDTKLIFSGELSQELISMQELSVTAGNSKFSTTGNILNPGEPEVVSWEKINARLQISEEFNQLLVPLTTPLKTPQEMVINLVSSGSQQDFDFTTALISPAGGLQAEGNASYHQQGFGMTNLIIKGKTVDLAGLLNQPALGTLDFSMTLNGEVGERSDIRVDGLISQVMVNQSSVDNITVQGHYREDSTSFQVTVDDPRYMARLTGNMRQRKDYIELYSHLTTNQFNIGSLIGLDTSLVVSSNISSTVKKAADVIETSINGSGLSFLSQEIEYYIDTLSMAAVISDSLSEFHVYSDNLRGFLEANFDVQQAPEILKNFTTDASSSTAPVAAARSNRSLNFELAVTSDKPIRLLSNDIKKASELSVSGKFQEQNQSFQLEAGTGAFEGFGFTFDSLELNSSILQNKIDGIVQIGNIHYDSLLLGDLSLRLTSEDSVSISKLSLAKDSVKLLEVDSRINPRSNGIFVYLDRLVSFDQSLNIDPEKPIIYQQGNLTFDRYRIKGEWMNILVDGDFNEFELVLNDTDLRQLNYLLPLDSTLIGSGKLDAVIAMVRADSKINLQVNIDSLTIKNSPPMMIKARAETEEDHVPVTFSLNSATNKIQLEGNYFPNRSMIAASLELDINELHIVEVFLKDMLTDIDGQITGNISIDGNLKAPDLNGVLNFQDVKLTTLKPRSTFLMKDETVYLDNYGISLQNFTIYDQQENPLVVDGNLITRDYKNFEYDLAVKAEDYWLINNPRQEGYQLQGNLVIDSDLKISGAPDQTAISANLKVKDTTALTYIMPQQELELISGDGIVEFVDPENPDTVSIPTVQGVYDSLIASLPELSIESTLQLEKDALLEVVVDANSGDYIQVKGTADLKFEMDHTKNMELTGTYTMNEGFYQLSFYDLVKKRFLIKPESTVTWNGDPKNGDLDIVAFYTIKTSSLGLIGHEIGENEKGLYRRALPYEVGINIRGNLENPQISFSLDLPVNDKANYPVLSNKLGRLLQPEYEAELNRQVFGLLVLGGFIPESGAGEVNENLIATTALSNSVNAILASQLNRFAGQLVPGVDINVGLQSYSDFSTGSGNTRTAMDFKVSKRLMDDRLSIEVGGGMDINANGSESYAGSDSFRGDVVVIYDLTESGNKQLKIFNNETYDIVYHEIRNTGVSLIFIREFDKEEENN